jgi:ribonuclease HI
MTLEEEVKQLCEFHKIAQWDYMAVSDGSGTTWNEPAGWCAFLYCRSRKCRYTLSGGFSKASCHAAEYMGIVQPLMFLESTCRVKAGERKPVVVVMTDRQCLVNLFQKPQESCTDVLTAVIAHFLNKYEIRALWLPGESVEIHKECHRKANAVRKSFIH